MTSWSELSASLTPERLNGLLRADLPVGYQFVDQMAAFDDVARDARSAAHLSDTGLWEAAAVSPGNADQQAVALTGLLSRIDGFEMSPAADANPNAERQSLVTELASHRIWLVQHARPFRAPDEGLAQDELERVHVLRGEMDRVFSEAQSALESIRSRAAETGAVTAAALYKDRAVLEDKSAQSSAIGLMACALALITASVILFVWLAPRSDATLAEAITGVAGRTLALAALAYGMTFYARNFRAHRHLATVNRFKANALEATPLLREGIATDDQRDVIVTELVRSIFSVPDTGFVNAHGDSVTIQTPVTALLGGMVGRSGS